MAKGSMRGESLFEPELPAGFQYRAAFINPDEEASLRRGIEGVVFSTFEMRGVAARRRVAFFGASYDAGPMASPEIPAFLLALREKLGAWAAVEAGAFAMALINEYRPGAPIGWHRDAPQYGIVAGVSLLSACRMKFRPYVHPRERASGRLRRTSTHEVFLEPRSAYLMTGSSRSEFEHHIPAATTLRYSITFRTLRGS